jgi:ribosomal protein L21E
MTLPSFKVGDRVRITRVPPSVEREMPSETVELFRRCVGQVFRVDGFGEYGHLELNVSDDGSQAPDYSKHTIWIEPESVGPVT